MWSNRWAWATRLVTHIIAPSPPSHPIVAGVIGSSTLQVRKLRFREGKSLFPDHTATLPCSQAPEASLENPPVRVPRSPVLEGESTGRLSPKRPRKTRGTGVLSPGRAGLDLRPSCRPEISLYIGARLAQKYGSSVPKEVSLPGQVHQVALPRPRALQCSRHGPHEGLTLDLPPGSLSWT